MANMLGAFLGKRWNSSLIFDHLKIAESEKYQKYLNQYDLIYIDFSRLPENCTSYQQYISQIITGLKNDLIDAYPDYKLKSETAVWDKLEGLTIENNRNWLRCSTWNIFQRKKTVRHVHTSMAITRN